MTLAFSQLAYQNQYLLRKETFPKITINQDLVHLNPKNKIKNTLEPK